ncbi:MAG: hypothetical protein CMJ83_16780 [Planctomycetes bacterium]|nr:hypothetical protein [Planctomycetota bacterium]
MSESETSLAIFFPVYNDERTIRSVTEKALSVGQALSDDLSIIIIDDCSPDRSGEISDELAREHDCVTVVHHQQNLGYGAAVRSGLERASADWICFTDGDDEYDLEDLRRLWRLRAFYDLIITFRYVKIYSTFRVFISWVYNVLFRILFRTRYRDISTGLRLVRRAVVDELELESTSPFIGAEITVKTMLKGYRVGEVGIQTFPRKFGHGASTSLTNIRKTITDMFRVRRHVFSPKYDLPPSRDRKSER